MVMRMRRQLTKTRTIHEITRNTRKLNLTNHTCYRFGNRRPAAARPQDHWTLLGSYWIADSGDRSPNTKAPPGRRTPRSRLLR